MTDPRALMQAAIDRAKEGVSAGQSPFGCAISLKRTIVAAEHNRVQASTDITAHAEITALREACRRTGTIDLHCSAVRLTGGIRVEECRALYREWAGTPGHRAY